MDVTILLSSGMSAVRLAVAAAGISNSQIVLILLIVGTSALMLISARRRMRKGSNSPAAYTREQRARIRDEESLVQEMEEVMARLEAVSSELQARLDTRFAKMESVLRDADDRIDRLERLLRQSAGQPTLDQTIDETASVEPKPTEDGPDNHRRRHIYELADAGRSPVQIAEQTAQSTGEVELILALRSSQPLAHT